MWQCRVTAKIAGAVLVIAAAAASALTMTVLTAAQHFGACLALSAKTPVRSISEVIAFVAHN